MKIQEAIDLNAVVTTPENIRFEYRIAGPFRRLPALALDFVIRVFLIIAILVILAFTVSAVRFSSGVIGFLFLVFFFLLDWFYGLFFETYWNGQTPGKWLTQIRVMSVDGRPINAYQATVRNFLRWADFAPFISLEMFAKDAPPAYVIPTFLVSLICMFFTNRFQRLGDIAAGTMVVVNERSWVPQNVKLEDPRVASLSEYIPANFRLSSTLAKAIALYAERRGRISPARRLELAAHLAKPLLKRFDFREDTSPDLLLCALYYREFVNKEAFSERPHVGAPPKGTSSHPITAMPIGTVSEPVEATLVDETRIASPPILETAQVGSSDGKEDRRNDV